MPGEPLGALPAQPPTVRQPGTGSRRWRYARLMRQGPGTAERRAPSLYHRESMGHVQVSTEALIELLDDVTITSRP